MPTPTGSRWPVTLSSGDIVLRPLRYRDRNRWTAVRNANAAWLSPWEATNPVPNGQLPTYHHMVQSLKRQARAGAALPFVITERTPAGRHRLVGQLTVSGITEGSALTATLGYWVAASHAGRGIAPTAVALATDYCFSSLGLHRMEVNIRPENSASLRVVHKLGFRSEGVRRSFLHIGGRWADHESFALTREECPDGLLAPWLARQSAP